MSRDALYAPWRIDYIRSLEKPPAGCFLCDAAASPAAERLVLWTTEHTVVLLNRYPYTNGHLLVAPRSHQAELDELSPAEQGDLVAQTASAIRLLKRAVSAQGFNVGLNLGRCAGAGVPGHLHQHVVPRWNGDVNFMNVVGEVGVVPQAITQMHRDLVAAAGAMGL